MDCALLLANSTPPEEAGCETQVCTFDVALLSMKMLNLSIVESVNIDGVNYKVRYSMDCVVFGRSVTT